MHTSSLSRLRMALFGSLMLGATSTGAVAHAAPADQSSPAADQVVNIDAFAFAPAEVSIPVGATLGWTNLQGGARHTASALDGLWDSGVLSTNDTFSFMFAQSGDFAYECDIHPSMRGLIHVVSADPAPQLGQSVSTPPTPTSTIAPVPPTQTATPTSTPTRIPTVPAARPTATSAPYYGY